MRLAKTDLIGVLTQLAAVFPSKDRGNSGVIADAYYGALQDLTGAELREAADAVVKHDRFFPRPSRLREIALQHRSRAASGPSAGSYDDWWLHGRFQGKPCPVCGSVLADLPTGRLGWVHDHERHMEAGVGYAG